MPMSNNITTTILQYPTQFTKMKLPNHTLGADTNNRFTINSLKKLESDNNVEKIEIMKEHYSRLPLDDYTLTLVSNPSLQNIPEVKKWVSAVYNYNKTWLKPLPVADNALNKLIKSFFTMRPLMLNKIKKKTRLSIRRFFKLSLDQVFTSNVEIKHTSDTAYITVFTHNKKKINLIYASKKLWSKFFTQKSKKKY